MGDSVVKGINKIVNNLLNFLTNNSAATDTIFISKSNILTRIFNTEDDDNISDDNILVKTRIVRETEKNGEK